jgi:hypothetical protein
MAEKKYVLLKWKDGWQEVVGIEPDAIDLSKYYVIERVERFGRLVITRPEGEYPGLIVIDRSPMEISEVALFGKGEQREIRQASTYQEGMRLEHHYDLKEATEDLSDQMREQIRQILSGRGTPAREVLSMPAAEKRKQIETIGKALQVVGGKNQEDLIGFIELLLEEMK